MMSRHVSLWLQFGQESTTMRRRLAKDIILNHHERLNGSGYTRG